MTIEYNPNRAVQQRAQLVHDLELCAALPQAGAVEADLVGLALRQAHDAAAEVAQPLAAPLPGAQRARLRRVAQPLQREGARLQLGAQRLRARVRA